jgi:site-specific recombinase XerD
MEQVIDAIMVRLNATNSLSVQQMEVVKYAVTDVLKDYRITPMKNQLVCKDVLTPPGYKEFFVDKIMQGLSEKTINQYKFQVDTFLRTVHKKTDDISSEDISMYLYHKKICDNVSTCYQNNVRCCLSAFFGWMYDHGYIKQNPIRNVKAIKEKKVIKTGLTSEEFEKLMDACETQRDRAIVAVLAGSGIRRSELCSLKLSELDLRDKRFKVCGKGDKERMCFLTPRAKYELERYLSERPSDSPYVFVTLRSPHGQLQPTSINRLMTKLGDRAGVPNHTHKLRHFFADNAHEAGVDVLDIARMMGHASIRTTQIYISQNVEDLAIKHSRLR